MVDMTTTIFNRLSPKDVDVLMEALAYWGSATSCDVEAAQRRNKISIIMSKLLLIKLAFVPETSSHVTMEQIAKELVGGETGNG